jgi:hypothetical protein
MRQDRFLIGILAGIGILVVLSVALFFLRRSTLEYGPETSPDGVVRNYIVAVKKGDYDRAFAYLSTLDPKIDKLNFRQSISTQAGEISSTGIEVGQMSIDGDHAIVTISLIRGNGGLFGDVYREQQSAELTQKDGAWKITSMPYPFWNYSWVTPVPAKPAP